MIRPSHPSGQGPPNSRRDQVVLAARCSSIERAPVPSRSRKGDCWDNAVAESFFATLRAELVDDERYATRSTAESSIGQYIDAFYNIERLHSHLDYVSPIEFELKTRMNQFAA